MPRRVTDRETLRKLKAEMPQLDIMISRALLLREVGLGGVLDDSCQGYS